MARADLEEKGLEEIVEKPLGVVLPDIPSSKPYFAGATISAASAGAPLAGYRIMAVPNDTSGIDWRYAIFGKNLAPYWKWVVYKAGWEKNARILFPNKAGGYEYADVSGIIKANIDKVALYEQSPTLKAMAEALKNNLFGYEFAMTFPLAKLPFDIAMILMTYLKMSSRGPLDKDLLKPYLKANAIAAGVDIGLFGVSYGITKYMLGKVAEIIQSPAGTYPSEEAAIEAVKNMIYNKYFPFVNGPMKTTGNILMIAVPVISILTHLYLIHRASKKSRKVFERIKEMVK